MANDTQIVFTARDDTRGAIDSVARGIGSIKTSADGIVGSLGSLGGVLATTFAGFSVAGLVSGVNEAIHSLAELDDAAEITGASVEKLSALKGVAKISDFDFSQVEQGLVRLAKALSGADDEAKSAGRALQALKLDPEELRAMDSADAMKAVANALSEYRDGAGKTALAQDLLGKSGAALLPYLKDLAEVGDLVGRSTGEQAAQAEQYEKNIKQLTAGFDAWKKAAANGVLPALVEITDEMVKARKEGGLLYSLFIGLGAVGLKIAGVDLDPLKRAEKEANEAFTRLSQGRKALADLDKKGDTGEYGGFLGKLVKSADRARLESYIKDQEEVLKKATAVKKALAGMGHGESEGDKPALEYKGRDPKADASGDKAGKTFDMANFQRENDARMWKQFEKDAEDFAKAQAEMAKAADALLVPLEQQAATLEKEAASFGLSEDAIQKNAIARLEEARAIAAANGAWPAHLAFLDREIEARKRIGQASENLQIERMLGATPTGQMEKSRQEMELLAKALQDGRINESQYLEAVQTQLKTLPEDMSKAKSAAEELGLTFASAFENAIVGGKSAGDIIKGLGEDILRITTRKTITEPLAQKASDFFKSVGTPQAGGESGGAGAEDWFGKLAAGAKDFIGSLFSASSATKGLAGSAGDSAANLAKSILQTSAQAAVEQTTTAALASLSASAYAASAALTSLAGGAGGDAATGTVAKAAGGGGSGGGLGEWAANAWSSVKSFFGFAQGGIMTSAGAMPLMRYATGGIATSPQLALFGEGSMNEAYVPLPDGRRIPVNLNGGGNGRAAIINMNISTPDAGSFRQSQGQLLADMQRALATAGRRNT